MFLQFPEPVLGRTRSTRKDSVRVTESFGIGITEGPGRNLLKSFHTCNHARTTASTAQGEGGHDKKGHA